MRGLISGDQSSVADPKLQFFCRSGGFLVDVYAATYSIYRLPETWAGAAVAVVSNTVLDTVVDKLGTGRYAIITGDTGAWNPAGLDKTGTYEVVIDYQLVNGGVMYRQVTPFELLEPGAIRQGARWIAYAGTADLIRNGYVGSTLPKARLQYNLEVASRQIERWTQGRWFEPRYATVRLAGQGSHAVMLPEAIIAVDTVSLLGYSSSGVEASLYDNSGILVFNRHLDGEQDHDDRYNPRIELAPAFTAQNVLTQWAFPDGAQNIQVNAVLGFTDPEFDSAGTLIGSTPEPIKRATCILVARTITDVTLTDIASSQPGRVASYQTDLQKISFFGSTGSISYNSDMSGDPLLDGILQHYVRTMYVGYPERRASAAPEVISWL